MGACRVFKYDDKYARIGRVVTAKSVRGEGYGKRLMEVYISTVFPGGVRKVAVNAGLGCSSRCTYCNNASFSPEYTKGDIRAQIEEGKSFVQGKGQPSQFAEQLEKMTFKDFSVLK